MELRTALFLLGMIVIVIIAFVSFHRSQQKPYKLPRRLHRRNKGENSEVDPLFEPRQGPLSYKQADSNQASSAPQISEADNPVDEPDDEIDYKRDAEITPAPLIVEKEPDASDTLELDLQPSDKKEDKGPHKEIEYVALLRGVESISRDQALGVYRQHEYTMEKQNRLYGFNIANGLWRNLEHEEQDCKYRDICLTIQMSDHDGPVSESELHRFSQMSLEVAEELDRPIVFSMDFDEALLAAKDLDRFRKDHDIIQIVSIVARSENGLTMNAVHREAEKLDLHYSEDNIYHRIRKNADKQEDILFSMANMFKPGELPKDNDDMHTGGLTLFMRLPAVSKPVDVYNDMIKTATSLATRLNGILVDQETRPVNESMTIGQTKKILKLASSMDARGISAGSELANRLF